MQWNQGTLFLRASASCSKILKDKKYLTTVKNSGQTLFFRASASWSRILNDKKYIQYMEKFQGNLCFQGKRNLLKNPEKQ